MRSAEYLKNDASLWWWLLVNIQSSAPCGKERETREIKMFLTLLSKLLHFSEIAATDFDKNANQTKFLKQQHDLWHLKTLPHSTRCFSCPSSDKPVYVTDRAASHSRAQVFPHQPSHWLLRARRGRGLFSGLLRMPQVRGRGDSGVWWLHTRQITSSHSRRYHTDACAFIHTHKFEWGEDDEAQMGGEKGGKR